MTGYFGSKAGAGVKERIISLMPPHDTYIELFLGSGVVLNHKPRSSRQIGVESNRSTVAKFDYPISSEIITGCAFTFLTSFNIKKAGRTVIYADPPYLEKTRKGGGEYGDHELSDDDHRYLIGLLKLEAEDGAFIMLSGYRSKLYDDLLGDWKRIDYQTMTHSGVVTESLWISFEPGEAHWHSYAGDNKAQRQQIKRKAERWAAKYGKCSQGERLAIMAALQGSQF